MLTEQEQQRAMLTQISEQIADNTRKTEQVLKAFPGGDCDGHRRYHESVIEWQELRNKMVREALIKAAQASGLAALGWIGFAIWQAFKLSVVLR